MLAALRGHTRMEVTRVAWFATSASTMLVHPAVSESSGRVAVPASSPSNNTGLTADRASSSADIDVHTPVVADSDVLLALTARLGGHSR